MIIDKGIREKNHKLGAHLAVMLCISGILTACGQVPEVEDWELIGIPIESDEIPAGGSADGTVGVLPASEDSVANIPSETTASREDLEGGGALASGADSQAAATNPSEDTDTAFAELDAMQMLFGRDCISEQTFEVQLSEYAQKVYFVPFAPSEENPRFRMQLIQDGQILKELPAYVPEQLSGSEFTSLDAVSFGDVNFDGSTDILLLETYGDTRFAAVYYGEGNDTREYDYVYFGVGEELSEYLTDQVNPLTFSGISNFLTGGKKNGEFASYQEAYTAVSKVYDLCGEKRTYNLIYFDGDDIPELVAGVDGYFMSLFTYDAGRVYCLMNDWGYGAMGNLGYEYVPGKNSLRNYNTDFAGAIVYTTYMTIGERHSLEFVATIETVNFDDVNGDGIPSDDEMESDDFQSVNYIDGVEITDEECASYDVGEYEYIEGGMSLEELKKKLGR